MPNLNAVYSKLDKTVNYIKLVMGMRNKDNTAGFSL
jgi:hypothetical protein